MTRRVTAVTAAVLVMIASGCGDDRPTEFGADGAWSRPTPPGAVDGVLYLEVTSDVADELVGVEVPTAVAAAAELHTSSGGASGQPHHGGGGAPDDTGPDVISMTQLETVPVAADGTVVFEPGGNHIMLVDLTDPLREGETYTATLEFASGRSLAVDVVVTDNPPG